MSSKSLSVENDTRWLELAKQGVPEAIALVMNYYFHPKGIDIKVGWKHDCLLIVCASQMLSQKDTLVPVLERILAQLGLSHLKNIHVYSCLEGNPEPLWSVSLDLSHLVPSGLTDWLSQGQHSVHSQEKSTQATLELREEELFLKRSVLYQGHRFLRFALGETEESFTPNPWMFLEETALLPLDHIQEVIHIFVGAILPVPHLCGGILGIYNHRGSMLWIVDLNQQLGDRSVLSQYPSRDTLPTIVICHNNERIGLVVPHILDIETYAIEEIRVPDLTLFPPKLRPFIQSYLPNSLSPVLNIQGLMTHETLQLEPI